MIVYYISHHIIIYQYHSMIFYLEVEIIRIDQAKYHWKILSLTNILGNPQTLR